MPSHEILALGLQPGRRIGCHQVEVFGVAAQDLGRPVLTADVLEAAHRLESETARSAPARSA